MDTTVITAASADYGVGDTDRVTFVDSQYTVGEQGDLHVFRRPEGNIGSFPKGAWRAVIRGNPQPADGRTEIADGDRPRRMSEVR